MGISIMAGTSAIRIMISINYLVTFLFLLGQNLVESQILNSRAKHPERVRTEIFAREKTLHLEMSLKDEEEFVSNPSCTSNSKKNAWTNVPASDHNYNHRRLKRQLTNNSPREGSPYGTAAYFSGSSESLRYKGSTPLPNHHFSAGVWIKPEGGQNSPVNFFGIFDSCLPSARNKGWSFGIKAFGADGENEAAYFFSMRTDRSRSSAELSTFLPYKPLRWTHLMATYDGLILKLYLDGSQVAVRNSQRGSLFAERSGLSCKELIVGGDYENENYFRGMMDEINIWSRALSQEEIKNLFNNSVELTNINRPTLSEAFRNLDSWDMTRGLSPALVNSNLMPDRHDIEVAPPPCGVTICDDPDVVHNYATHEQYRKPKTVRYRIINVMLDNGTFSTVNESQINLQHEALNEAFGSYNITWEKTEVNIRNSSLRLKTIIFGCDSSKVGNGRCNEECQHERTGNDGGDCDEHKLPCDASKIRNGVCDFECNRRYHNWDGGDCCNASVTDTINTCFDPSSSLRTYMSIDDYKKILRLKSDTMLNIYFASWTAKELIGLATFPWEKNVLGILGGTVVQPSSFGQPGKTDSLIHELGHNLGLWHVHHGVTEMDCSDPCVETRASLELGDLCADTRPTPQNEHCEDPNVSTHGKCQLLGPFTQTPYNNYMSYATDSCTNNFSPQQVARMHCYLDLVYGPWQSNQGASVPPLSPMV